MIDRKRQQQDQPFGQEGNLDAAAPIWIALIGHSTRQVAMVSAGALLLQACVVGR